MCTEDLYKEPKVIPQSFTYSPVLWCSKVLESQCAQQRSRKSNQINHDVACFDDMAKIEMLVGISAGTSDSAMGYLAPVHTSL